ncbi:hypothetical protein H6G33_09290 [Calothrix sp. FACHB-1219]|uniref:hypothetical protein n=1 Tax=unclassified Calothrix TaxID=2619626 RepID=UPI001689CC39|nr:MULTISPECIES: hypothetical protein [unclassified Calothrix]MBD2201539.1 hypothetical protein [Calothrix sp. FACHB-168]MBD2217225.1 hypothetical protein [Calothrix sp. FACHB-1219]
MTIKEIKSKSPSTIAKDKSIIQTTKPVKEAAKINKEGQEYSANKTLETTQAASSIKDGSNLPRNISYQILAEPLKSVSPDELVNNIIAASTNMADAFLSQLEEKITQVSNLAGDPTKINNPELKNCLKNASKKCATIAKSEADIGELANGGLLVSSFGRYTLGAQTVGILSNSNFNLSSPFVFQNSQDFTIHSNNSYSLISDVKYQELKHDTKFIEGTSIKQSQNSINISTNNSDYISQNTRLIGTKEASIMGQDTSLISDKSHINISGGRSSFVSYDSLGIQSGRNISILASPSSDISTEDAATTDGAKRAIEAASSSILISNKGKTATNTIVMGDTGVISTSTGSQAVLSNGVTLVSGTTATYMVSEGATYMGNNESGILYKGGKLFINTIPIVFSPVPTDNIIEFPGLPGIPSFPSKLDNCIPDKYKQQTPLYEDFWVDDQPITEDIDGHASDKPSNNLPNTIYKEKELDLSRPTISPSDTTVDTPKETDSKPVNILSSNKPNTKPPVVNKPTKPSVSNTSNKKNTPTSKVKPNKPTSSLDPTKQDNKLPPVASPNSNSTSGTSPTPPIPPIVSPLAGGGLNIYPDKVGEEGRPNEYYKDFFKTLQEGNFTIGTLANPAKTDVPTTDNSTTQVISQESGIYKEDITKISPSAQSSLSNLSNETIKKVILKYIKGKISKATIDYDNFLDDESAGVIRDLLKLPLELQISLKSKDSKNRTLETIDLKPTFPDEFRRVDILYVLNKYYINKLYPNPLNKILAELRTMIGIGFLGFVSSLISNVNNITQEIAEYSNFPKLISSATKTGQYGELYSAARPLLSKAFRGTAIEELLNNDDLSQLAIKLVNNEQADKYLSELLAKEVEKQITNLLPADLRNVVPAIKDLIISIESGKPLDEQTLTNQISNILSASGIVNSNDLNKARTVYSSIKGIISDVSNKNIGNILKDVLNGNNLETLVSTIFGDSSGLIGQTFNFIRQGIGAVEAISKIPDLIKLMDSYKIPGLEQVNIALSCLDLFNKVKGLIDAFPKARGSNQSAMSLLEYSPRIIQTINTINEDDELLEDNLDEDELNSIEVLKNIKINATLDTCFRVPVLSLFEADITVEDVQMGIVTFSLNSLDILSSKYASLPRRGDRVQLVIPSYTKVNSNTKLIPYQTEFQYTATVHTFIIDSFDVVRNKGIAYYEPTVGSIILEDNDGLLYEYSSQALGVHIEPIITEAYLLA